MATTYDDWKQEALLADQSNGAERWKAKEQSSLYDYQVIRYRLDELVALREAGDAKGLLYYLNEGLHGNMGGMGSPALYARAQFGTKHLVTEYIEEVELALRRLVAAPAEEVSEHVKIAYLRRAHGCFGRSALMLSGAGSLGPFHLGVLKALLEQNLLPAVISGASAGSMMAAFVATRSVAESRSSFEQISETQTLVQFEAASGRRISENDLIELIAALIPDLTFLEALEVSGVHLNISVAPSKPQQRSRLLNAITAPNVCVREAVLASCAIPGLFPAVTLMAKDTDGDRQAYVPSRKWVDGSITGDLPAQRLARLYGINHFITSQTNPIVLWSLRDPATDDGLVTRLGRIYQASTREWLRAIYPYAMETSRRVCPRLANATRMWFSVATQEYTADINILPTSRSIDYTQLVSVLTTEQTAALIQDGERATWPKLETIRLCTQISRTIEELLSELEDYTV